MTSPSITTVEAARRAAAPHVDPATGNVDMAVGGRTGNDPLRTPNDTTVSDAPAAQEENGALDLAGGLSIFWREWLRPFFVLLLILLTVRSVVIDWNHVPTGSMKPSILEGDRILVNKLAYDLRVPFTLRRISAWSAPARGDVVVFLSPQDGKRLVKRVVAVAGDRIEMRRNRLWINGNPAQYRRIDPGTVASLSTGEQTAYHVIDESIQGEDHHSIMTRRWLGGRSSFAPRTIADGEVFVMGDNRDDSSDSRVFGPVPMQRIVGRATAVVASVDPDERYLPRWERFFLSLP